MPASLIHDHEDELLGVSLGDFGIQALQGGWIPANVIEACRIAANQYIRGDGKLFIRIFPHKPVTFIVPWAAGGGTDIVARKFAQELQAMWKQTVVVENVAGASGIIGAQRVQRAAPDGYTLMMTTNGVLTGNRFLFKKLPYDPDKDFVPVTQLTDIDMFIMAKASLPANNLKELVALAKKEPGRLSYGSYGKGSQPELLFGLLAKRENLQLIHVPYKGVGPAITTARTMEKRRFIG